MGTRESLPASGILTLVRLPALFFLVFVATPLAEIALFITVGQQIGIWYTVGLVLVTAVVGAALVSAQGSLVIANIKGELIAGRLPGKELAHGGMILVAGALLVTPGFLTDAVGFLLLIRPVREVLRRWGQRRLRTSVRFNTTDPFGAESRFESDDPGLS